MTRAPARGVVETLRNFGDPIYARMSALADAHGAINLGQGFPSPDGPEELRKLAATSFIAGPNQYVDPRGTIELRRAIAAKTKRFHSIDLSPDTDVLVTTGAQEGLFAALLALVEPGDEVIVFDPVYATYLPAIALARGIPRRVTMRGRGLELDMQEVERVFGPRTRAVIVNTPMNPTGRIFSQAELRGLAELCAKYDAILIGDEVYEHIRYDGNAIDTVLNYAPAHALAISSLSKTFSYTGWRIGWVQGTAALVDAVNMVHQISSFCNPGPLQVAAAHALRYPDEYYRSLRASYLLRRDLLCGGLRDIGIEPIVPAGGFFACVDARDLGFESDVEACYALPERAGVAAVPTSLFCAPDTGALPLLRLCFAKEESTLREALARLGDFKASLKR